MLTELSISYNRRIIVSLIIAVGCMFVYILSDYLASMFYTTSLKTFKITTLLSLFLSYVLAIFYVSLLFEQFSLTLRAKSISLFFYFFFLTGGIQALVHYIMQTGVQVESVLITSVIVSTTTALLMIKGFPVVSNEPQPYFQQISDYFSRRSGIDWVARILAGGTFMFITYYLMNSMIFPFVKPYYELSSTLFSPYYENFEANRRTAMITHSAMMLLAFIPLFALWKGSKSSLLFWVGFPLFIVVALQPFILYFQWPLGFRFPILIQTMMIMYIQAIILVQLFYLPTDKRLEDDAYNDSQWSFIK